MTQAEIKEQISDWKMEVERLENRLERTSNPREIHEIYQEAYDLSQKIVEFQNLLVEEAYDDVGS